MLDALLCEECWSLTTVSSNWQKNPQKSPAQSGPETCDLCRLLAKSIIAFRDIGHRPELQGADWRLPNQKLALYSNRYPVCGVHVTYTLPAAERAEDKGEAGSGRGGVEVKILGRAELEITTPLNQNLPWSGFANATNLSTHSGSEECFIRIKGWLGECLRDHQNCNEGSVVGTDAESPKRLIDTGPLDAEPALRLIDCPDGDGGRLKYCALSHCWGKEEETSYVSTRKTYQLRRNGISFQELPQMFRDAVLITRRVGCRYLWVRVT